MGNSACCGCLSTSFFWAWNVHITPMKSLQIFGLSSLALCMPLLGDHRTCTRLSQSHARTCKPRLWALLGSPCHCTPLWFSTRSLTCFLGFFFLGCFKFFSTTHEAKVKTSKFVVGFSRRRWMRSFCIAIMQILYQSLIIRSQSGLPRSQCEKSVHCGQTSSPLSWRCYLLFPPGEVMHSRRDARGRTFLLPQVVKLGSEMCTLLFVSSRVEGVLASPEVTSSNKVYTFCLWLYCYLGPKFTFLLSVCDFLSVFLKGLNCDV